MNKILSHKHSQADGKKVHEDFESDESCVWRISENNLKNQAMNSGETDRPFKNMSGASCIKIIIIIIIIIIIN